MRLFGEPGVGTYGAFVESATAERGGVFATVAGTLGEWVEYKVRVDEESDGFEELVTVRLFFLLFNFRVHVVREWQNTH